MKDKKQLLLALLTIIGSGALGVWLIILGADVFGKANASTQAAIIAGFVGVFSLAFTYWKERTRSIHEAHRHKKIEVYSKFYDLMFAMLERSKKEKDIEVTDDFQQRWMEISRGVLFYGSPQVVTAFSSFKAASSDSQSDFLGVFRRIGRILLAMRSDIGLSNKGLDEFSIHQIYVTDDLQKIRLSHEHP